MDSTVAISDVDIKGIIDCGVMSRNEVRALFGLPPVDGGDVVTINTITGVIPLSLINSYFARAGELNEQKRQTLHSST